MEKKKWVKLAGFAMVFLLSLFLCVGCAENNVEDSDEVTYIDFGRESATSRGIESWNEDLYPPESLYWTYTAKKIRGNYTTGQTLAEETVLKNGPAQGLGTVGPFSVGVWEFKLFGYLSCAETGTGELEFRDLVYTGKTGTAENAYTTTIDKRPSGVTDVQEIIFELTPKDTFWNNQKGILELENMYLTVPEGQRFTTDTSVTTVVRVTVSDVTDDPANPVKVAVSTTDVTGTVKESGARFDLNNFVFETAYSPVARFDEGIRNLKFEAEYKDVFTGSADATQYASDDGWAPIGTISAYSVPFTKGVKTTLSGDINDIQVAEDTNPGNINNNYIATKILKTGEDGADVDDWSYYNSLKDAVAAYGDADHMDSATTPAPNPIILVRDVENGGSISLSKNVVVKNCGFFVNNLSVSGTYEITFKLADSNREYRFKSGKIASLNYDGTTSGNVWLHTDEGTLTVNAPSDNVYHTGKADKVTITEVAKTDTSLTAPVAKGYFLGTAKTGADPETSVSALEVKKGSLNIGGQATIETLTVSAGSSAVTVCGRTTSYVGNIDDIRDGVSSSVTSTNKDVFKEVKLYVNGGSGTSPVTKYGIEGMYMNLVNNTAVSFVAPTGLMFNCWNTAAKNREGDDYSATGKIAVVKDSVGNYPSLYAVWGYPVAKIKTTAGTYDYFGALHDAVEKYAGDSYGGASSPNPIILLRNVDTDTIAPASRVEIKPEGFSLKNITVSTTQYVDVNISDTRKYTFGGFADNELDEFSYIGSDVTIRTTGGHLTVNAATDDVSHYGTVHEVLVSGVANDVANSKGYHFGATADGTVILRDGFLEIDGDIAILNVQTGSGSVSLKGRANTDAVVTTCQLNGTQVNTWYTTTTETLSDKKPYKQVILNANADAKLKVGSTETALSGVLNMHYIEGLKLSLTGISGTKPANSDSTAILDKWNTVIDASGASLEKNATIRVPETVHTLYACWNPAVASIKRSDGKIGYFYTLRDAVAKYSTDTYKTGTTANVVTLLRNIEDAGTITPAVSQANILSKNYAIKNLKVGAASKTFRVSVGTTDGSRNYSFSGNGAVLTELSNSGNAVTVKTASGTQAMAMTVDASTDTVTHTGAVGTLNINNVKYDNTSATTRKACYDLKATASTVNVSKGSLYIDSTTVSSLYVKATATGQVSLIGNTSATVTNFYMGTSTLISNNAFTTSQTVYGAYKQICFDRNTYSSNANRYIYGIEGMYLTLPVFNPSSRSTYTSLSRPMFTVPTRTNGSMIEFVLWSVGVPGGSTSASELFSDGQKITVSGSNVTLYAMWGGPMGGVVFYVNTSIGNNYKFYNKSGSSFTYETGGQGEGSGMSNRYYVLTGTRTNASAFGYGDRYYIYDTSLFNGMCVWMYSSVTGTTYSGSEVTTWPSSWGTYSIGSVSYSCLSANSGTESASLGWGRSNTNYFVNIPNRNVTTVGNANNKAYWTGAAGVVTYINKLRSEKSKGCNDWYVPSAYELYLLFAGGTTNYSSRFNAVKGKVTYRWNNTGGSYCIVSSSWKTGTVSQFHCFTYTELTSSSISSTSGGLNMPGRTGVQPIRSF